MNSTDAAVVYARQKNIEIRTDEPLSRHTTFRIGGVADAVAFPKNPNQLCELIGFIRKTDCKYYLLGNGSNVLFSDDGYRGIIIITTEMSAISFDKGVISCMCGAKISSLCKTALENSISGFEPLYGIPGSVGGGIYMNAGAYGGEISDVLHSVDYIDKYSDRLHLSAEMCDLSYRHSIFEDNGGVVISAEFVGKPGNKADIKAAMDDFMQLRISKQPLEFGSAGSTFKRPEGAYAAELIDRCGLKGFSVGEAAVSEKHAGFIINKGNASCHDVQQLIEAVQSRVKSETGFTLECEVRMIK